VTTPLTPSVSVAQEPVSVTLGRVPYVSGSRFCDSGRVFVSQERLLVTQGRVSVNNSMRTMTQNLRSDLDG